MAIITKVIENDDKDPEFRKIGIVTVEDIVEELLSSDIADERELGLIKGERRKKKEKLVMLFNDHRA